MAIKFGDNLKRIRSEKNISQGNFAELINMHATHVSRYERNISLPSIEVLKKMAEKLNVSTDELLYGAQEDKVKGRIQDNELLTMFNKAQTLRKDDLHCIKNMLNAYILKTDLQQKLIL